MYKRIKPILISMLAIAVLFGTSLDITAATYQESRLSLYGMNNGGERDVSLKINAKGQLQVIIKNGLDKKGNKYNAKILYKKNGKKEHITKLKKSSKKVFVDGYTTVSKGKKVYKIKIKGSKAVLSIYDKRGKKTKTQKFDCSKIKTKYKRMNVTQMIFISKNKLRVLYGDTDSNGVPYGGGSAILNLSTGKAKKETRFSFMPQGYSNGRVYAVQGSSIFVAKVETGEVVAVFQLPSVDTSANYAAVSYRNGRVLYVNKNGAYMAKDTDKELKLVYSFKGSKIQTKYVCCAAIASKKCFYVGFGSSEGKEPDYIVKYSY